MTLLKSKISFNQTISWGSINSLSESFIKKLFDGEEEVSIKQVLNGAVHPHFKIWLLLRTQVVIPRVLHLVAQYFAETFIEQQKNKGVFIDFRTEGLVKAKQQWLDNEISAGILAVHQRTANQIEEAVADLQNEEISQLANMVKSLLDTDATYCFEQVYNNTSDFRTVLKEHKSGEFSPLWTDRLSYLKKLFSTLSKDKNYEEEHRKKTAQKVDFEVSNKTVESTVPVGTILAYAGEIQNSFEENGWMKCDGRVLKNELYQSLFTAIAGNFGKPNDTEFNLPDLRGVFLRGVSGESNNDPDKDKRFALNANGNENNMVGSAQQYATAVATSKFKCTITNGKSGNSKYDSGCASTAGYKAKNKAFGVSSGGDLETRPINKYVYYIIKYTDLTPSGKEVDIPIGSVLPFAGTKTSALDLNWRLCDGTLMSNKGEFKKLFEAIQFTHGGVSDSEYMLPDYRGYFLRGVAQPGGKDPDMEKRSFPNPEGKDGFKGNDKGQVGSVQATATAAAHNPLQTTINVPTEKTEKLIAGIIRSIYKYKSASTLVQLSKSGGDIESRPLNMTVNWYIRFK